MLRIFYFSEGLLEGSELFPDDNVVAAVKHASARSPGLSAEIWSSEGKLAVVRPCSTLNHHPSLPRRAKPKLRQKIRLAP